MVCLVGWILGRTEKKKKKKWKVWEKISGKGVWLRKGGGEKSGGAQLFFLWAYQNSISPKWRENVREKEEECVAQNCPSPSNSQLFVFFYLSFWCFFFFFFFWIKFCTVHIGSFCLFLSSFFNILLAFAYFINKKKKLKCPYNFFLIINLLLFVNIFSNDIMVNLYQLCFSSSLFLSQPNKKDFHPSTFPPLKPNTNKGKLNLFYPSTFLSSHNFLSSQPNGP